MDLRGGIHRLQSVWSAVTCYGFSFVDLRCHTYSREIKRSLIVPNANLVRLRQMAGY